MALGNRNSTHGDKGSKFRWELSVLRLLKRVETAVIALQAALLASLSSILSVLNTIATNTSNINSNVNLVSRTPGIITTSTSGTVASGTRSVTFYNRGSATGTVLGEDIEPEEVFTWNAGSTRDTLGAISYDATGTTFVITTIV
jgi:hypothetical protein